jgi:predicted ATPase
MLKKLKRKIKKVEDVKSAKSSTAFSAIDKLDSLAERMVIYERKSKTKFPANVILVTKLADALGTTYQSLWRWISNDQLPRPVFFDNSQSKERGVYHLEEAKVIAAIIADHFAQFEYFRKSHHGTVSRLSKQLEVTRASIMSMNVGVKPHGTEKKARSIRKASGKRVRRIKR